MLIAYVGGKPVGPQDADATALLVWLSEQFQEAELRTADGRVLGRFVPEPFDPKESGATVEGHEQRPPKTSEIKLDDFWRKMRGE